ncbi:MAG: metallophosphoesterase [Actinomycetota bacterium]|nr:metallophosphoesterase [Actinomycetota bacterium]
MRLHVVSDVHGEAEALARAADGSDVFVCLGDLILFLDYDEPGRGIFADLFGADHAQAYIEARTANRFDDARALSAAAWARIGITDPAQRWAVLEERVRRQYAELFSAMPEPALLTFGNVDVPALWPAYLREGHQVLDGGVAIVDGLRWGFVGGGLVSPMHTPYEITPEEFGRKVDALGPVDVLFTHIPPALPELTYDVAARRFEIGSPALLRYVREHQPRYHLFGHVHQPLAARTRIGRTECINVGHFHGRKRPFAMDL